MTVPGPSPERLKRPKLTAPRRAAIREALTARLAGPLEDESEIERSAYEGALEWAKQYRPRQR